VIIRAAMGCVGLPEALPQRTQEQFVAIRFLINLLILLATPAGLEPATCRLEGDWSALTFNAHSDKTAVFAPLKGKAFLFLSERPRGRDAVAPPSNFQLRPARICRTISMNSSPFALASVAARPKAGRRFGSTYTRAPASCISSSLSLSASRIESVNFGYDR
jgi:hypothetical protein